MASNITNIYVFDAVSYERDSNDEIQDSQGSNDIWPYVLRAERHERLGEPLRFTLTVAAGCEWNKDFLIKSRHRLYFEYSDSSVIPCRVTRVRFDANSGNMTVEAVHLWADLSERKFIYIREPDNIATLQFPLARITVDDALSLIFDDDYGIPSIFTKGTVDASVSSKLIALNSKGYSHNQLLQEVCRLAACEFEVAYSDGNPGTVTFNFDETIGTQTSPENRLIQNNRFKLDVDDAQDGYFSRIIPFASGDGEDISMSDGWLYVDSGTENGPGTNYEWVLKGNPFFEDDMYTDGTYFVELYTTSDPNEIRSDLVIGDVDASTSTLTTTSIGSGSVSPNDVIKLRIHSTRASAITGTGSRTNWINDSTAEASKGIVEEARFYDEVSGYDNLFEVLADGSGDMSDGSTDANGNYVPDGMNLVQGEIRATVNSITAGTSTIKLDGDHTEYLSSLEDVVLTGTDDNDGTYSVLGSPSFSAGETTVVFSESFPGTDQGSAGGLATYTGLAVSSTISSAQYINVGDAAMRVVAETGHQVCTDAISITATQDEPYLSVWCTIGIESGRVAMWIERDEDGYRDKEPKVYEGKDLRAISLENFAPVEIGTTKDVKVYWEALEDGTIFNIDALAVTQHKGVGEVPFRQYMGAAGLMERAGIDMIKEGGTLEPQYVSEFFDDQTNEVHLGCTVEINDLPDGSGSFAIDATPRVIELKAIESINGRPRKQIKVAREKKRIDKRISFVTGEIKTSASKAMKAPDEPATLRASTVTKLEKANPETPFVVLEDATRPGLFRKDNTGYSSQADGGYTVAARDGRLWERTDRFIRTSWYNPVENDSGEASDNLTKLQAAADAAAANGYKLIVDGSYHIDDPLEITTSADFEGKLICSADNQIVNVVRSNEGEDIDPSSWTLADMVRGSTRLTDLAGYRGYTVLFESTEVAIDRDPSGDYKKKACFIVTTDAGDIEPALPDTFSDRGALTVTAYPKEDPITINGLEVDIQLNNDTTSTMVVVSRSNVILNNPHVYRSSADDDQEVAISVQNCANVTINNPIIDGFNDSSEGYGINVSNAALLTVNDALITNCRHAVSGRHGFDLTFRGGYYSGDIDNHWGYGLHVSDVTITGPVQWAGGGPVVITGSTLLDTKFILKIRDDTPELRGSVSIRDCEVINDEETGNLQVIGYGNASNSFAFSKRMVQPEFIEIDNITYSGVAPVMYGVYFRGGVGVGREYDHTMVGDITVKGLKSRTSPIRAVEVHKNDNWQTMVEDSSSWATSTSYAVGDYVTNDDVTYRCNTAHTSGASTEPGTGASWTDNWIRLKNPTIRVSDMDGYTNIGTAQPTVSIKTFGDGRNDNVGYQLIVDRFLNFQPDIHEDSIQDYALIINSTLVEDIRGWSNAAWVTSTSYDVGDEVIENGVDYVCATAHTSGTFATDLAANRWEALNVGADIQFNNCNFLDEFLFAHKSDYRFVGGVIEGKLTSSPTINLRIKSSVGVAVTSAASSWSNANQIARTGIKTDETIGPQVDHHVGLGDNPSWSGAPYADTVQYLASNTSTSSEVGYAMYSDDGSTNRRVKVFMDAAAQVYGWWQKFSSGRMNMVWGEGNGSPTMTLNMTSGNLEVTGAIGTNGVSAPSQAAHIADPSGGATQDTEARAAINDILVVLENLGHTATS